MGKRCGGDDPTTAIKIAKTIDDERLRTDTLKSVVTRWLDANPEAAKSWDGRSELPPEIKKLFDK